MSHHTTDAFDLVKVSAIGFGGTLATITLADIATTVSILVGLATLIYVVLKTVILWKNRKRFPSDLN